MIAGRIEGLLREEARSIRIADVRIGLGYTAVLAETGLAGVAYTPREEVRRGCSALPGRQPLAGRTAAELLALLLSADPLERAIGLATANALLGPPEEGALSEGDVMEVLDLRPSDRVGMVGYFAPLISPMESRVASLTIFERLRGWPAGAQPAERAADMLPSCSVALITSTTLITDSLDVLLDAATPCRLVALLGPSTPLLPQAFGGTPITWLSGIRVTHPLEVLRVVSEGGGTREFLQFSRKVNIRIARNGPACPGDQ